MRWLVVAVIVMGCGDNVAVTAPDAVDAPPPLPTAVFAQTAYIKSTQPIHDAHFSKFGISGDGKTLVAAQYGTVSVYTHGGGGWRVAGELVPAAGLPFSYGTNVAISNDGTTAAVGASYASLNQEVGRVYVFRTDGSSWVEDGYINDVDDFGMPIFYDEFPASLALSSDGNTLVVGSRNQSTDISGVRTYERTNSTWSQVSFVGGGPDDFAFGLSLALSPDGSVLAARVFRQSANDYTVDVLDRSGNTWVKRNTLASPDQTPYGEFGISISCSARCETIVIGAIEPPPPAQITDPGGAGVAYVFEADGALWTPTAKLRASNAEVGDNFGIAVAVSGDASTVVVGASKEFSASTGINGDAADNSAPYAGAAYVFRRYLSSWAQVMYLKASNAETVDIFGTTVGLASDGTTIAVSAMYENGGSAGVNGDQSDNSQPYAGAIYAFEGTY